MRIAALIAGLLFCLGAVVDAFQTIILPRRPTGKFRITRLFYIVTWTPWAAFARRTRSRKVREQIYSTYGPGSLLFLLMVWALLLVSGFGLLFFSMGTPFADSMATPNHLGHLRTDLYVSGTTLFTLGLGDVVPRTLAARALIIFESGTGLGLVALVIAHVDRAAAPPLLRRRTRGSGHPADRVGALGGGDPRVARLLPDSLLLPLAAR
jgi:hypothetical protein